MKSYAKTRSRENYIEDKLGTKSKSLKAIFHTAMNSIDKMCQEFFKVDSFDVVIADVSKLEGDKRDDEMISVVQQWVNRISKTMKYNTIKVVLSAIKSGINCPFTVIPNDSK